MAKKKRISQVMSEAIAEEMARDENIVFIGEDVESGMNGNTMGLFDQYGAERVINTPVSEAAYTGMAIGAAMKGLRPVIEYCINTLQYVSMEMLVNQAVKLKYMTGGQVSIPMTVIVNMSGAGISCAAQHSDSTWAQLIHMGMKVVVPSGPIDAKGLYKAAIRENDPVVIYLPALLLGLAEEVPEEDYVIPLGQGSVKREGTDLTIIAVGHMVPEAIKVAEMYEQKGVSIEVIDPRTLYPLDKELILNSVRKTGKAIVTDDGYRFCSWSSEVAAIIGEEAFDSLKSPVKRITRPMSFIPYSRPLEWVSFPYTGQLIQGVAELTGIN